MPQIEEERPFAGAPESNKILKSIKGKNFLQNINSALHNLIRKYPDMIVMGQDIIDPYGGAFKVTQGLSEIASAQVIPTPISEASTVGVAGGMAIMGMKPVVEVMFGDFLTLTMDQVLNHLAQYRFMYNEQVSVPVVIRAPMGGRRGYGPSHSQTIEKHFFGIPGLQVVAPSPLHPIEPIIDGCMQNTHPTLLIENKIAYNQRMESEQPGMVKDFFIYYGGVSPNWTVSLSLTEFEEENACIICYGGMLSFAMSAARHLLVEDEISVRIVVPSQISPLPEADLLAAIKKDVPLLAVEESNTRSGFGSEVLAFLAEHGRVSNSAVKRLGAAETAIASSKMLEDKLLPGSNDIIKAIEKLLEEN